jgi:hypothetical protein
VHLAEGGVSGWISVVGWRRFQHYDPAKRQPPWVKTYTELLDDEEYLQLSGHLRSVLHGIWLAYASSRCRLHADARSLSSRLRLRVSSLHVESLVHAGFIELVASKTLAEGYHDASPRARATETETEVEVEPPSIPPSSVNEIAVRRAERETSKSKNGWVENASRYTGCRYVRGEVGISGVYDPLGTEPPPEGWPYPRPTIPEIRKALEERAHA